MKGTPTEPSHLALVLHLLDALGAHLLGDAGHIDFAHSHLRTATHHYTLSQSSIVSLIDTMNRLDRDLSGLCRPAQPAELQHGHPRSDRPEAGGRRGRREEACPKARVAACYYRPCCSQTSSMLYTSPKRCGMVPASSALKGKFILAILESIILVPPETRSAVVLAPQGAVDSQAGAGPLLLSSLWAGRTIWRLC